MSHNRPREQADRWTIASVLAWTTQRLADLCSSPRLDAEVLLAHSLSVERIRLYTDYDKPLSKQELAAFRELVRRRLDGEPVAYICGEKEFWSLPLRVTRHALVPRPETELLVECALDLLRDHGSHDGPTVVDVGTGSGAIAIALAHELSSARVIATDIDPAALALAADNARRCGVDIELVCGDLLEPFGTSQGFDLIVSNPPYIGSAELADLATEVARWEPRLALDGGDDGLAVVRRLIPQAASRLKPGAHLLLEIGATQGASVLALATAHGLVNASVHRDLASLDRVLCATKDG